MFKPLSQIDSTDKKDDMNKANKVVIPSKLFQVMMKLTFAFIGISISRFGKLSMLHRQKNQRYSFLNSNLILRDSILALLRSPILYCIDEKCSFFFACARIYTMPQIHNMMMSTYSFQY